MARGRAQRQQRRTMEFYITCARCGKRKRVRDGYAQRESRFCSRACWRAAPAPSPRRRAVHVPMPEPADDFDRFLQRQMRRVAGKIQRSVDRVNMARWGDMSMYVGPW